MLTCWNQQPRSNAYVQNDESNWNEAEVLAEVLVARTYNVACTPTQGPILLTEINWEYGMNK